MNLPLYKNCVLDHRYFSKSFRDWSGNSNHGNPSNVYFQKKPDTHILTSSSSGVIEVADSATLQGATDVTIIAYGMFEQYTNYDRILAKDDGSQMWDLYLDGDQNIAMQDGSGTSSVSMGGWQGSRFIAFTCESGSKPKGYLDGVYKGEGSNTLTFTADDSPLFIMNVNGGGKPQTNPLKGVLIYDTVLTNSQIAQAYEWTQTETTSPSYPKKNFHFPSLVSGREDGLIAAYDMKNVGQKIIDKTGNGNDGAITKAYQTKTPFGPGLDFDLGCVVNCGSDSSLDDLAPFTFSFMLKPRSAGEESAGRIVDKSTFTIQESTLQLIQVTANFSGDNGLWSTPVGSSLFDKWSHIVVSYDRSSSDNAPIIYIDGVSQSITTTIPPTGTFASDATLSLQIGNTSFIRAMDGQVADFRAYNKILSQSEVSFLYKQYATLPYLIDDLKDANESISAESGAFLSNTEWRIDSGSFKISRDETNKPREKVIECTSAGMLYTPSQQAFGTWEFSILKADSSNPYVSLTADKVLGSEEGDQTAVYLEITNKEAIRLRRNNSGLASLFYTIDDYINHSTWYRLRIEKRYDGQFTVYIKGGSFTNWTLVDPTGGYGTNPETYNQITDSNYLIFELDSGDKVADIEIYNGVLGTNTATPNGTELLVDNDMETAGYSDWTAKNLAVLSKETASPYGGSQNLKVLRNTGLAMPLAEQTILTPGTTYAIEGYARGDGSAAPIVVQGGSTIWTGTTSSSWQYFYVGHSATSTEIQFGHDGPNPSYVEFDDLSVQEIT